MYNYELTKPSMWMDAKFPVSTADLWTDLFSDWNSLLGNNSLSYRESFPPFNVSTDEDGALIEIGLAGWKKDELSVTVSNKKIIVTGTAEERKEKEGSKSIKKRMTKTSFERKYSVPECYNLRKVKVHFEDGLLSIEVPYKEKEEDENTVIEIN